MAPEMMTPNEVAFPTQKELDYSVSILVAALSHYDPNDKTYVVGPGFFKHVRILLAGYKADQKCFYDMETYMLLGSAKYMAKVLKNHLARMRGPELGGEGTPHQSPEATASPQGEASEGEL